MYIFKDVSGILLKTAVKIMNNVCYASSKLPASQISLYVSRITFLLFPLKFIDIADANLGPAYNLALVMKNS